MNYFGLFISEDFVRGHCRASPISTTFGNPQLSLKSDFEIEDLEVISVYFPRKVGRTFSSVGEDRRMSIVQDEAPVKKRASTIEEDTAFMELAGKTLYAKEVREQDEKDSPEITRSAIMAE